MVKLPTLQPRGATIRGPVSSISGNDVANQYQIVADALGTMGKAFEAQALEDAANNGQAAVYRDQEGTLRVDRKSNFSATGRAYNRAAQQGYLARLSGDIRRQGAVLAEQSKGNVDVFNSSWKAFRDQTMTDVPREFRGAVETVLDTNGPELALGVSETKRKSDLKEFEGNIKAEISLLDDDMSALARAGGTGTPAYLSKQSQLKTLWSELAENPDFTVGAKEAEIAVKRMESRHLSEAMLGTVEQSLETGGIASARDVAKKILTDDSLALEPSERRQYANLANERINGYVAETKANLKPVQDQSKTIQERLKQGVGLDNDDIDTTAQMLARGGDMAGALELYEARSTARMIQTIRLSDNPTQMNMAETAFSQAAGGAEILAAIRGVESEGNPTAESPKGASGLMQVMPGTGAEIAAELGDAGFPANGTDEEKKAYLKDPVVSMRYGEHYFNKMMTRYNGDREAALIAYNGGQARADAWLAAGRDDKVIPKESADYYKKVIGRAGQSVTFTPEEATASKAFLQGRTDKDASHIDNLNDGFAVKLSRLLQAAPPEIRDKLGIYSGARSNERQAQLFADAVKRYGSEAAARKWVAPPGKSNHNHGNAADLSYNGASLKDAPVEVVKWLHDNAQAYGLKFPLRNENWHIEDSSTRGGPTISPDVIAEYRKEATADAKSLFTDIKAGYDKGMTPAITDLNLLTRQLAIVDDQDLRKEVADYLSMQTATASMQGMAPAQVESLISTLRSDSGDGATIAQQQIIAGMESAQEARATALKSDPIGYAMNQRMIAPVPALDLSQPDTWGATFQSLQRGVDVLQARGLVGNVSALRPEMKDQISRALATSTPADAINLLGSMATNLNTETYRATLNAIASKGDGKVMAAAGALVNQNPEVAESILRGQALMKENSLLAPRKTDSNTASINALLPIQAFGPTLEGARQSVLEAATARYADLSHQAGDTSGELDDTRMETAINEVTGGLVDMNGYSVIAPRYGMSQRDFDSLLGGLSATALAGAVTSTGQPVSASDLRNEGRLRAVADGRYVLEFGNPEYPTYAMRAAPHPGGGADLNSVFVLDLRGQ